MKPFKILLLVVLTAAGCYTSPFPLNDPSASEVDLSLEGVWEPVNPDPGDGPSLMHVMAFNENEFYVELEEDTLVGGIALVKPERMRLRVFVTNIAGESFASVQELGTDDKDFMFVNVSREGGRLTLKTVSQDLFEDRTFVSQAQLVAFIEDHIRDEKLYDSDVTRYRKQE